MKKIISLILLVFTGSISMAQGIKFEQGQLKDAIDKARTKNKLVFVDVYTIWCGPCKQMSKNVFPLDDVGAFFNANFISYKLDAEDVKFNGPELAKKYEVKGYPAYLFLNGQGQIVYKSGGAMPAETFINIGRAALGEDISTDYRKAIDLYEQGNREDGTLYTLISQFAEYSSGINNQEESKAAFDRYNKASAAYLKRAPEKFINTNDLKLLTEIYQTQGVRRGHVLVEYLIDNYSDITEKVDEEVLGKLLMYINYSSIEESAYNGHKTQYKEYLNDISGSMKAAYAFNDEAELPAIPFLTAKGDMEYAIGQKDYDTFLIQYELFLSFNKQAGAIDYLMPARRILDMGKGTPTVEQLKKCIPFNQIAYDQYKNAYVCTDFGLLMAKVGDKQKAKDFYNEAFEMFKEQGERGQRSITYFKKQMEELDLE